MSNGLGELLSKAREDLGISLEAAADATKIRMDFLECFEKNSFDFNLPDIYKREFLKTYAEFLKLDTKDVMALCPIKAFVALTTSSKRREMVQQVAKKSRAVDHSNIEVPVEPDMDTEQGSNNNEGIPKLRKKYIYIATAISIPMLLVPFILSHTINKANDNQHDRQKNVLQSDLSPVQTPKSIKKKILLMATDKVKVLVRAKETKDAIFSGTLTKGCEKIIEYAAPVQIYYDNGSVLSMELSNGERLHLESGLGAIEVK